MQVTLFNIFVLFFVQVVKDIGLDASDEKLREYVWSLLKSGQVILSRVRDGVRVQLGLERSSSIVACK